MNYSLSNNSNLDLSFPSELHNTPMKPSRMLTRNSFEEYKKATHSSDSETGKRPRSEIVKVITEFLLAHPSGATLLEIAEHLQSSWPGFTATRGYTYGKGSAKRIALGALNSSKAFELQENRETGVKVWRIKPHNEISLKDAVKEQPAKRKGKVASPNTLKSSIRIPKGIEKKARNTEIISLLEKLYDRVKPSIAGSLQATNVFAS